jgi:hypothetical protein
MSWPRKHAANEGSLVSDRNKRIKVSNANGSTSYTTPEEIYDQFVAHFNGSLRLDSGQLQRIAF